MSNVKVSDIAKELGIQSKEVVAIMAGFGVEVKSTKTLEEKYLNMIIEKLSKDFDKGGEFNIPNKNNGYGFVEEAPAKEEPKKEIKKEEPVKEAPKKEEKKEEPKKEEPKKEKKPSNPQPFLPNKKKENKPKEEKKERVNVVVNTRTEAIDVSKIERREKLEDLVSDLHQ